MSHNDVELVNWNELARTRGELGAAFPRILGYFREDGVKSIQQIEQAYRARNSACLVRPAHTLKGESAQFGAHRLSAMSEEIEMTARRCVETRMGPEELIETVVALRRCFDETVALIDGNGAAPLAPAPSPAALASATAPAVPRKPAVFGRRPDAPAPRFGRAT